MITVQMLYQPHLDFEGQKVLFMLVFPGGWGRLGEDQTPLSFLFEHALFSPTPNFLDPDKWLWENTEHYWSATSYESVRLGFVLDAEKIPELTQLLNEVMRPRKVDVLYMRQEVKDLHEFWKTDRDTQEDQSIRDLFGTIKCPVYPYQEHLDALEMRHVLEVQETWGKWLYPYGILLGTVEEKAQQGLEKILAPLPNIVASTQPIKNGKKFETVTQLGWRYQSPRTHYLELLTWVIFKDRLKVDLYYEFQAQTAFFWLQHLESPSNTWQKILDITLTKDDFERIKYTYNTYLDQLFKPKDILGYERLLEFADGIIPHLFQTPLSPDLGLDINKIRDYYDKLDYQTFCEWFEDWQSCLRKM